jgi:hypothetical protein
MRHQKHRAEIEILRAGDQAADFVWTQDGSYRCRFGVVIGASFPLFYFIDTIYAVPLAYRATKPAELGEWLEKESCKEKESFP